MKQVAAATDTLKKADDFESVHGNDIFWNHTHTIELNSTVVD